MGIVYNANYLAWFEVARTEFCRRFGKSYREWEADGYFLPVAEAYCKYRYPASYDDAVLLYCGVPLESVRPSSVVFEYRLKNKSGKVLTDGWTKHAFVNADGALFKRDNKFYEWLKEEVGKWQSNVPE
jgi:acyl-CoA thioester hydrolase